MTNSLRILIVSDIHYNMRALDALKMKIQQQDEHIDFIICPGDVSNIYHKSHHSSNSSNDRQNQRPRYEDNGMAEAQKVLNALLDINPCVYFIPGNHDPSTYFQASRNTEESSDDAIVQNLHMQSVRLAPNLVMYGCGGSPNAYWVNKKTSGKPNAPAYPHNSEDLLYDIVTQVAAHNSNKSKEDCDQIILLTHTGPSGCQTTRVSHQDGTVDSGSKELKRLLVTDNPHEDRKRGVGMKTDDILLNIHGHVHKSWGIAQLQKVTVINPGSLKELRYGILQLHYSETSGKWSVENVQLCLLNLE